MYLQMGHLRRADNLIAQVASDQKAPESLKLLNMSLRAIYYGDLVLAETTLRKSLELEPENLVVSKA